MDGVVPVERATVPTRHYIGGRWSGSDSQTFSDHNPFDGSVFAQVAAGGRAEAERAVAAAAAAFPAWAALAPGERQRLFLKAADIAERRTPDIIRIISGETGSGAAFAARQVKWSVNMLRQAASWGYQPWGDLMRSDTPGCFAMVTRKPMGVVAGFTPWNGAFNLAWRTAILPMAFGNTVVMKPSEEAPISAGLLHAEILDEAGFPPGTINVVTHAPGAAGEIADVFFESPAVRVINFTGSSATGRMLAERAARALKRIVLELGGYNPMLVLADADLDGAVNAAAFGAFFHQGQICLCTRRVFVDRTIHDAFVEKLAAKTRTLVSGNPADKRVVIGPLINLRALALVQDRIRDAAARGATIVTGGTSEGLVYAPTILTRVAEDAVVMHEETFGPVLVVEPFDDVEEALRRAQDTRYGLSASIMTGYPARALDLAQRLDTGIININAPSIAGEPALPNGGVKDSGWGRSGHYSVEDFTEIRLITMADTPGKYPI